LRLLLSSHQAALIFTVLFFVLLIMVSGLGFDFHALPAAWFFDFHLHEDLHHDGYHYL
jgi:hypothetical protein